MFINRLSRIIYSLALYAASRTRVWRIVRHVEISVASSSIRLRLSAVAFPAAR